MRPEVRQLQYFIAVADELNFTRAAERLHVAQQSLSTAIAQLEALLGIKLLERTSRSVTVTPAGEAWLPYARETLAAAERAAEAAEDLAAGRVGRLRVGLAATNALDVTPRLLRAFAERFPGVELAIEHFDFEDPSGGLHERRSDVAIVRPPFNEDGLELIVIGSEPRFAVLAADHPLADRSAVDFAEIVDEPWMDVPTDPLWCAFPASTSHQRGLLHETSTRVHAIHPSGLPLARGHRMERRAASAFPRASHPADREPDDARRGGDRPTSTDLELRAQHHIGRSSNR